MLWELSGDDFLVSLSLASSLSFICGWIADRIMGYAGFGVLGNWLLLLVGCYGGLFTYNHLGYRFEGELQLTIIAAFAGATVLLVLTSAAKALTRT
ncbi:MAG: hypothetical protein KDE32_16080 [Novosphingobium sp.]|nr:hypothetical protein [Novosphingobium sp.]